MGVPLHKFFLTGKEYTQVVPHSIIVLIINLIQLF